jgi:hypothetical protein
MASTTLATCPAAVAAPTNDLRARLLSRLRRLAQCSHEPSHDRRLTAQQPDVIMFDLRARYGYQLTKHQLFELLRGRW